MNLDCETHEYYTNNIKRQLKDLDVDYAKFTCGMCDKTMTVLLRGMEMNLDDTKTAIVMAILEEANPAYAADRILVQIKQLLLDIVGEDEKLPSTLKPQQYQYKLAQNRLRAELRSKIEKL